jgi:hypothetical protein
MPSREHVQPLTHVLSCDNGAGPISVHVPASVRKSPAVEQEIDARAVVVFDSNVTLATVVFKVVFHSTSPALAHQQSLYWPPEAVRGVLPHIARAPLAPSEADRPERAVRGRMLSGCPQVSRRR